MADNLILKMASVGPWPMNSYALICPHTDRVFSSTPARSRTGLVQC